jgi:hypothetical protein
VSLRAAFYIDGFNLYHAIADLQEPWLKWLDLRRMAETLVPGRTEHVVRVVFCTAYYPGDANKRWRHDQYLNALRNVGVSCVLGHYVHEAASCRSCGSVWQRPSEKQTDINIALSLYHDATVDLFDVAYLVTADSDQAATARFLSQHFPDKKLITVAPPGRNFSANIERFAAGRMQLTRDTIARSLFPAVVLDSTGTKHGRRPREYDPPSRP